MIIQLEIHALTLTPPCDLFSSTMSYDYNIWLTVTDSFGCIDSTMQTATVLCQPLADFDNICLSWRY